MKESFSSENMLFKEFEISQHQAFLLISHTGAASEHIDQLMTTTKNQANIQLLALSEKYLN